MKGMNYLLKKFLITYFFNFILYWATLNNVVIVSGEQ